MEMIGTKYRELVSVLFHIPFSMGYLLIPLIAYYIRDWQHLQFALSIPSIFLLSYYWLIAESPRWLLTVGRVEESAKILEKAAKMNDLPHENIRFNLETLQSAKKDQTVQKGNFLDLVRTPNMRMKTMFMNFNWMSCGLCFYGLAQYIGHAGGNIFVNVAVAAAIKMPGFIFAIFMMKKLGRRKTLMIASVLSGLAILIIGITPEKPEFTVPLASIGVFWISISFPTVYLYGGELFPTVVRNVGLGTASTFARFGSMLAPFVADLDVTAYWLPPVVFGIFPLISAVLVFFLPETRGELLPETLEDGENFGKKRKESV